MASTNAVSKALAILSADRGGDVTPMRLEAWRVALEDVADHDLLRAIKQFLMTDTGDFLPPVAKLRAMAMPEVAIDTDRLLREIHRLGEYLPSVGVLPPRVDAVRARFGEAIALAYTEAGGAQLFASTATDGTSTTRDIARRTFSVVLQAEARKSPDLTHHLLGQPTASRGILPSPSDP